MYGGTGGLGLDPNLGPLVPTTSRTIYERYTLPPTRPYSPPVTPWHSPPWQPQPLPPHSLDSHRAYSYPPPSDNDGPFYSSQPQAPTASAEAWQWHTHPAALAVHNGCAPNEACPPRQTAAGELLLSPDQAQYQYAHAGPIEEQGHSYAGQGGTGEGWGRGGVPVAPRTEPVPLPGSGWPVHAGSQGMYADQVRSQQAGHTEWNGGRYVQRPFGHGQQGEQRGGQGW